MDVLFENRYRITRQRFLDMAAHPVRKAPLPLAWILLLVLTLSVAVYSLTAQDPIGAGVFLLLSVGCAFRIFFFSQVRAIRRFRSLVRAHGAAEWDRTIRIADDGILAEDGSVAMAYGWDQVAELKAVPGYLVLLMKGPEILRLDLEGFSAGTADAFVEYVRAVHPGVAVALTGSGSR